MTTPWNTLVDASVSSQEAPGRDDPYSGWNPLRLARMERLGASVEELAKETIESIMGYDGKGGHKPPRPDIQKMKDAYDLFYRKNHQWESDDPNVDDNNQMAQRAAADEWHEKYGLNDKEISAVSLYQHVLNNRSGEFYNNPQAAFDFVARIWSHPETLKDRSGDPLVDGLNDVANSFTPEDDLPAEPSPEGKKRVGTALKKYEQQNYPMLYTAIKNSLDDAYRRNAESYKLWPRMVSWIKDYYQDWLLKNKTFNRPNQSWTPISGAMTHIVDITTEGGKILSQLRAENRIPQNFDVNKLPFDEFERWLMDWKRENLGSENAGEIVYKYHDGWTIQKLTTADQLQYEGDEMGHCVGGYAHAVEDGRTIIYSLRDPKGMPHVTMEVEALDAYRPSPGEDPNSGAIAGIEEHQAEYAHPDKHTPGEHFMQGSQTPTGPDTPFAVVQVQGNSNQTPKPEYQRKIKEFLDYLRSKGWRFERSENWFAPFDADHGEQHYVRNDEDLDDWWEMYRIDPEAFKGQTEDEYGLAKEPVDFSMRDLNEMIKQVLERHQGYYGGYQIRDWEGKAQQIYHAYWLENGHRNASPERKERLTKSAVEDLQNADLELYEHIEQWFSDNWQYHRADIEEAYEELGGKYEEDEGEEEEGPSYGSWSGEAHGKTALDEDLWMEAEDKVRSKIIDSEMGDAAKLFNYLINLFEHNGYVERGDLPNPNLTNAGLPTMDEIINSRAPAQPQTEQIPGTFSSWQPVAAVPITIKPIDETNNLWFDEDGAQHVRYRPGWAKNPETGKMEQTGALEDTFLDKQGRQGQGVVAYNGDAPVGSLTWVDDPNGWHMIGTTYVHPDFRQQGIFNQMAAPLRESGRPIDAYVWNNPWLKSKVRLWYPKIAMVPGIHYEHEYDPDWADHRLFAILPGANTTPTEGEPLDGVEGEKKLPGGDVIGMIHWNADTHGIPHIEVHPDYQRQGLATELYRRANGIAGPISLNNEYSRDGFAWSEAMRHRSAAQHRSDCAVHNEPALPAGPCNCGADGN